MIEHSQCPACLSKKITFYKSIKDHSVSGESFDVYECSLCTFRFTQHIPEKTSIGRYYQSENYISHTDSKKGLFNVTYQLVRSFALKNKRKLIEKISGLSSGNILDYGCGTGAFLYEMSNNGWKVDGIEPDPGASAKAAALTHIEIRNTDEISNFKSAHFDVISLWHVLEHVHELDDTLLMLKNALKSGGKMVIAVPNYTSRDAQIYDQTWAAYDVPRHLYHFSPLAMRTLMNRLGLEVECIKPMWFDAFYVSLLSEKYANGRMQLLSAIWVGFISNISTIFNNEKCSSIIYIIKKKD